MDRLKGGIADKKTLTWFVKHCGSKDKFIAQLKKGVKVEMEHTDEVELAKEIALDHISEDCHYYDRLAKMEAGINENVSFKDERKAFGKYGYLSIEDMDLIDGVNTVGTADLQLLKAGKAYYLYLNEISINPEYRSKGYFSKFMEQLTKFADSEGLAISLEANSAFGSDSERLMAGYAKYGFKPNRGSLSGNMVRKISKT